MVEREEVYSGEKICFTEILYILVYFGCQLLWKRGIEIIHRDMGINIKRGSKGGVGGGSKKVDIFNPVFYMADSVLWYVHLFTYAETITERSSTIL